MPPHNKPAGKMVNDCLWLYAVTLFWLTVISWVIYFAAGQPEIARPLFDSADRFRDLTNYVGKINRLGDGPEAFGRGLPVFNYPAPSIYVFAFFLRGFRHPVRALLCVLFGGVAIGAVFLLRITRGARRDGWGTSVAILSTACLGFPLIFDADRGNLEGVVALVLGVGLVLFATRRYRAAAVLIGFAASLKPFPAAFFFLFLPGKRYREFWLAAATAAGSVLIALTALGPNPVAAFRGLQPGVQLFYERYIMNLLPSTEARFDHSVMDGLKILTGQWGLAAPENMHRILLLAVTLSVLGLGWILSRLYRLPLVNQMILLAVATTLFPPLAGEYGLLHLYVPFGMMITYLALDVSSGRSTQSRARILQVLFLFALLFSPLSFTGRFSGFIKMLLLIMLAAIVSVTPMPSSSFGEEEFETSPEPGDHVQRWRSAQSGARFN